MQLPRLGMIGAAIGHEVTVMRIAIHNNPLDAEPFGALCEADQIP